LPNKLQTTNIIILALTGLSLITFYISKKIVPERDNLCFPVKSISSLSERHILKSFVMLVEHSFFGSKQKVDRNTSGCWITASISPNILRPSQNLGNDGNFFHCFSSCVKSEWMLEKLALAKFSVFSNLIIFFFFHKISDLLSLAIFNIITDFRNIPFCCSPVSHFWDVMQRVS